MQSQNKADPAIYPALRKRALEPRSAGSGDHSVQVVLMDWNVDNGTVSVLAAADGSASLYLASGGGYIGGGQKYPEIRAAALSAVHIADALSAHFAVAPDQALPPRGQIFFYVTSATGVYRATATDAALRGGSDPLLSLGAAMQKIVTEYRLRFEKKPN